jgi:hypothetical protein
MTTEDARSTDTDTAAGYRRLALEEFGWEIKLGFNLAYYRTFAIPSIGSLLVRTGEITQRPQKRADDTGLIMYEMICHGLEHDRGRRAVAQLNRIHSHYSIANDDFLYILSALAVVPLRWIDQHGHRPLTDADRAATYAFYRALGQALGVRDIPGTYEGLARYLDDYEATHMRFHEGAAELIGASRRLLAERFPRWLRPLILAAGDALLDARLRAALGLAEPSWLTRTAVSVALWLRALTARRRGSARTPVFEPDGTARGYPDGYVIEQVGPAFVSVADDAQHHDDQQGAGQ